MGVIGLGRFGDVHARALAQLPDVELVAICSRSTERARQLAATCGEPRCYTDPAELLACDDIDAVDIVTEVDRHTDIALAAMQQGKHVFCEILVAPDLSQMDQLAEAAQSNDVLFMPGFLERFDARRARTQARIVDGDLGQLVSLHGRRNIRRDVLDEPRFKAHPLILQPGIHTIDQMLWLTGQEVRHVYAHARGVVDGDRPDTWWAMLHFDSGFVGVIEQSWFVPKHHSNWCDVHMEVIGTQDTVQISEPSNATWIWTDGLGDPPDTLVQAGTQHREALEAELSHFASCVAHGQTPRCTLQDARRALTVGLAIVESAQRGESVSLDPHVT